MSWDSPPPKAQAWFANLPLDDPRCDNKSCDAFAEAAKESQIEISWAASFYYGHYVTWFYAIILAFFICAFGFHQVRDWLGKSRSTPSRLKSKSVAVIRRFTYRRFSGRVSQFFNLPSYGVMFLVVFFFFAAALMVFAQHPYYRGRRGFGSAPLAMRAGIMAFSLIPMEIVLAGKYNLVTLLTGIGHEKLNTFHRWVGYIMLFLALIHAIPFIYQPLHEGGYAKLHEQYYSEGSPEFSGTPTLGMLVGLSVLSAPPVRRRMYEMFVSLHVLLAISFFGLCFWHAGQESDSWSYLWATLALWLMSYVGRIFARSTAFPMSRGWFSGCPTLLYRVPNKMLRAEIYVPISSWKWEPGQHVYLRFLGINGLENHPFTIANCSSNPTDDPDWTILKFLIRPRGGITARLASVVESDTLPGIEGQLSAIVEGPYGTIIRPRIENRYETAILVGGGGGISGVLPWLEHLSLLMSSKESTCVTQRVILVWIVRHAASLQWMEQEIREAKARAPNNAITVEVWVTSNEGPTDQPSMSEKPMDQTEFGVVEDGFHPAKADWIDRITFNQRPIMSDTIPLMLGHNRNIVIGCGPESMKIALSNTVAKSQRQVLKGCADEVKLHTDTFGW